LQIQEDDPPELKEDDDIAKINDIDKVCWTPNFREILLL
jgi:hypothetical protein